MNELKLVKNMKKYTKLMYLKETNIKEFYNLNGFNQDLKYLCEEIEYDLKNIKDFNMKFEGYGSLADALMTNSVYKENIYIDFENMEEVIYENKYLKSFIKNNDIDFIKCIEFIKIDNKNIIKENILNQFNQLSKLEDNVVSQYIKYLLRDTNIDKQIHYIKEIQNKLKDKLSEIEVDGSFLAKILINTCIENPLYYKLEYLIKQTFTNEKTIKLFDEEMSEYNKLEIPF